MPNGEYVYTCPKCGREGERDWMNMHLKEAHEVFSARERDELMGYFPKHHEYWRVRDRG